MIDYVLYCPDFVTIEELEMDSKLDILSSCADAVKSCEVLIITTGAGMGVDSGMPDYRGKQGLYKFWKDVRLSTPRAFLEEPELAWGFRSAMIETFRKNQPHPGYAILLKWITNYNLEYFVATSNVDGHFEKAGFAVDKIREIHGSVHYLQCFDQCQDIWTNDEIVPIDEETGKATRIPMCRHCQKRIARTNTLMFDDPNFIRTRRDAQDDRYQAFLKSIVGKRVLIVEIGAGTAVTTIRATSEALARKYADARLIRINPKNCDVNFPHLGLKMGSLDGLTRIDAALS